MGVRASVPDQVPVPEDAQGINTTAVALGVLGALLAIVVGLVVAGRVRRSGAQHSVPPLPPR